MQRDPNEPAAPRRTDRTALEAVLRTACRYEEADTASKADDGVSTEGRKGELTGPGLAKEMSVRDRDAVVGTGDPGALGMQATGAAWGLRESLRKMKGEVDGTPAPGVACSHWSG